MAENMRRNVAARPRLARILVLANSGASPALIAQELGTTPATVRMALRRHKLRQAA